MHRPVVTVLATFCAVFELCVAEHETKKRHQSTASSAPLSLKPDKAYQALAETEDLVREGSIETDQPGLVWFHYTSLSGTGLPVELPGEGSKLDFLIAFKGREMVNASGESSSPKDWFFFYGNLPTPVFDHTLQHAGNARIKLYRRTGGPEQSIHYHCRGGHGNDCSAVSGLHMLMICTVNVGFDQTAEKLIMETLNDHNNFDVDGCYLHSFVHSEDSGDRMWFMVLPSPKRQEWLDLLGLMQLCSPRQAIYFRSCPVKDLHNTSSFDPTMPTAERMFRN